MSKKIILGIVLVALGSFAIYWSIDHSPFAPLDEKVSDIFDSNAYRMSKFWYYITLVTGIIVALYGLRKILR